jgi:hypothetical protein
MAATAIMVVAMAGTTTDFPGKLSDFAVSFALGEPSNLAVSYA